MHGSLNVPIEHHPTIRYLVYNGYYKVMSNIPKMGQLPTPVMGISKRWCFFRCSYCATTMQRWQRPWASSSNASAEGLPVPSGVPLGARDAPYVAKLVEISKSTVGFVMYIYIYMGFHKCEYPNSWMV